MAFATLGSNYPHDIEGSQFSGSCTHYDSWPTEKSDHRVLQGYWGILAWFSVGHLDLFQPTKTKTKQKHQKQTKRAFLTLQVTTVKPESLFGGPNKYSLIQLYIHSTIIMHYLIPINITHISVWIYWKNYLVFKGVTHLLESHSLYLIFWGSLELVMGLEPKRSDGDMSWGESAVFFKAISSAEAITTLTSKTGLISPGGAVRARCTGEEDPMSPASSGSSHTPLLNFQDSIPSQSMPWFQHAVKLEI